MGVNIVVAMRGGCNKSEKAAAKKLGMQYVSIPWHCPFPSDQPLAKFLNLIQEDKEKKSSSIAAWAMIAQEWP